VHAEVAEARLSIIDPRLGLIEKELIEDIPSTGQRPDVDLEE
jgi:hypothetical protein